MSKLKSTTDRVPPTPGTAGTTSRQAAFSAGLPKSRGVKLTILGQVCSMKNRRMILRNRRTGKPFSAKSSDAERYAQDFLAQVPGWAKLALGSLTEPLQAEVTAYYVDMRSDLDVEIVFDCLQAAGVIANDRYIRRKVEEALID